MIHHLQSNQIQLCLDGGREFFDEGKLPGGFKPECFIASWRELIESQRGTIIGSFGDDGAIQGALGGLLAPDLNNGDTLAVEAFWYVIERYRSGSGAIKLLRAFELWARNRGARRIAMIHLIQLQPERLGTLYQKLGYHHIESTYLKEVV